MIRRPFDLETEKIFCARCGSKCEPSGHMMSRFLMCPKHGEFTIAPVVIWVAPAYDEWLSKMLAGAPEEPEPSRDDGYWEIVFKDEQIASMWDNCQWIDANLDHDE